MWRYLDRRKMNRPTKESMQFWKMVYENCDHEFKFSLQCGDIACDKCFTTLKRHLYKQGRRKKKINS